MQQFSYLDFVLHIKIISWNNIFLYYSKNQISLYCIILQHDFLAPV